jgi:ABC-type transport system substrate-binding protein
VAAPAAGAPEQGPRRGGTVVFGPTGEPGSLNPLESEPCDLCASYFDKVLEPAFEWSPNNTFRPRLVASVEYTKTPPYTVTFRIHPDARWSDRVPVTARDFVFTQNEMMARLEPVNRGMHRLVRDITAVDAKTVRVLLSARTGDFRQLFPRVLPSHALRGLDLETIWRNGIDSPRTGVPIASGPFLLRSLERGERMTFVRNPSYWGPHTSYLDRVVFRFCSGQCGLATPQEVLAAMRQGDVDMTETRDTALINELRRIRGTTVLAGRLPGLDLLHLRLGPGGHPALRSGPGGGKLVRRALAYGIDRVAIARTIFGEFEANYPPSDNAVLLTNDRHYRPNWAYYRHRPAHARRLLQQAGCRRGADGIYTCAGERLTLRFFTPANATFRVRTLEMMERQLREVGVDVEIVLVAPATVLFNQIAPSGAFDGAEFARFTAGFLGVDLYGCGRQFNVMGYCQRLVTAELDQADRILHAGQRARALNRADRRIARDVPVIPLYQTANVIAFRSTIRNVVSATGHELWNAENWWLAESR